MQFNKYLIGALILLVLLIVLYVLYRKNFKHLTTNAIALFTGAPKTVKDGLCCKESHIDYKHRHRIWRIRTFFQKLFKKELDEEPLFYTNAVTSFKSLKAKKPHKLDKNIRAITQDLLLRRKRFAYKSVMWITEASLFADNMFFNDQDKNVQLALFCKLFGHETKGGSCYLSTQNTQDLHYAFKRVCCNFFFNQKKINFLNLFCVVYTREMISNDLGANNFTDDLDTTTRKVLVPFWVFKRYNPYQFSVLTDDLDKEETLQDFSRMVVSFNERYNEFAYAKEVLDREKALEEKAQKEGVEHA